MKIAVLSDIHGNIYAFRAVIKQMLSKKIDYVFFLGDQLGYYYHAEEVYNEIDKWDHQIIAGNHERIFLDYLKGNTSFKSKIDKSYGECFSIYQDTFSNHLIAKIEGLAKEKGVEIDGYKFLLCHGSPLDEDQYIYPDANKSILDNCLETSSQFDIIFAGHTHYPMMYAKGGKQFINVGSVGQSRTVGGVANWGIFNTENGVFTLQNTLYNTADLKEEHKGNKNPYLLKVLNRNNE